MSTNDLEKLPLVDVGSANVRQRIEDADGGHDNLVNRR